MDTIIILVVAGGSTIAGLLAGIILVWAEKYIRTHNVG